MACDDEKCLPPYDKTFELVLTVGEATAAAQPAPIFAQIDWQRREPAATAAAGGGVFDPSRGLVWIFIFSFVSGLALNLTPCVYPLIPITVGFFAQQAKQRSGSTAPLAVAYVFGMSVTSRALDLLDARRPSGLRGRFTLVPKRLKPIMQRYTELKVWQRSHALALEVYGSG